MVQIAPFRALRPRPDSAAGIISVPYDVVNTEEARALAQGRPDSFLRVVRSEIEFPVGTHPYGEEIYDRARDNLRRLVEEGKMIREAEPTLYIYRLQAGGHRQTGLVARSSARDYMENRIKKHELTRKEKEADRTKHVDHLGANTGPVFLAYRAAENPEIARLMDEYADTNTPLYDVKREDGVRHQIYAVQGDLRDRLTGLFAGLSAQYIADGHHRAASASNVCKLRAERAGGGTGKEPFNWFLTVSFPDDQLRILPYNRAVSDLNGHTAAAFLEKCAEYFEISDGKRDLQPHELNLYMEGRWRHLRARDSIVDESDPIGRLDVSILQTRILAPLLGIDDPRTSERVAFVGGIRGDGELEKMVNSGEYALAFAMYPVTTEQLLAIADAGEIMPPKSTWFEPKLCSGFLVNELDVE